MVTSAIASTVARFGYVVLVFITFIAVGLSCIALLSQAVRTSADQNWIRNVNAVVVGAAYVLILAFSLALCLKRRISIRRRLSRIPKPGIAVNKGDVPRVQEYIEREFLRSCAIVHECQPTVAHRDGWGSPGTKYDGIRFRTAVLDTVAQIDAVARLLIPSMPALRHNVPMARHLKYIKSLISADDKGGAHFRHYTTAVQLARYGARELTEAEFETAMEGAAAIRRILLHYRMAQIDGSNLDLGPQR